MYPLSTNTEFFAAAAYHDFRSLSDKNEVEVTEDEAITKGSNEWELPENSPLFKK